MASVTSGGPLKANIQQHKWLHLWRLIPNKKYWLQPCESEILCRLADSWFCFSVWKKVQIRDQQGKGLETLHFVFANWREWTAIVSNTFEENIPDDLSGKTFIYSICPTGVKTLRGVLQTSTAMICSEWFISSLFFCWCLRLLDLKRADGAAFWGFGLGPPPAPSRWRCSVEWLKAPINSEPCLKFRSTQAEDLKALTVCQVFWMREWESVKGSESHTFTPKFSEEAAEWSCRRFDRNRSQLLCWSQESAPPFGCQVWFVSSRAIQEMKSEEEFKHSLVLNSFDRGV